MNHYIAYLRQMKEFEELFQLLTLINRPEEAAFVEYQRKMENNKVGRKKSTYLASIGDC